MSAILCFSKCLDQMAGTNLRHQPSGTLATWDLHFEKSIRGISQSISRWMSLIELAFAGDYDAVVALLDGDLANSAQRDELGHSAFFSAVIGKQLEVCKLLVSRGFDVNEQSSEFGFTLLHKACRAGSFEICKLLVESGADVHVRDPKGSDAIYNTITGSGDLRICQYLVSKGASCDGAFRLACFNGQLKIATWLLDETEKDGGDAAAIEAINAKGFRGNTALHLACQQGHPELCRMLITRGADVTARNESGCTPLHEAVLAPGAGDTTELLIHHGAEVNAKDADDRAPLHRASGMGHIDHCRTLLELGADINALDQSKCRAEKHNLSPLKGAVGIGDSALHYAILSGDIDMCAFLLDRGIDLHIKSALGKPIVHFACHHKKYKICGLLIDRGAKIDDLDYKQVQVPLSAIAPQLQSRSQRRLSAAAMASLHLGAGGRRHSTSSLPRPQPSAPTSTSSSGSKSRVPAVTHSATSVPNPDPATGPIMQSLTYSETVLQNAAQSGNTEASAFLLSKGADIHAADEIFGNTALHLAAQEGYYEVCAILLRHGADLHARNGFFDPESPLHSEDTALHLAAREGHWDVCQLLLQGGANAKLRNRHGHDCLAVADRSIRTAITRLWHSLRGEPNASSDHSGQGSPVVGDSAGQPSPTPATDRNGSTKDRFRQGTCSPHTLESAESSAPATPVTATVVSSGAPGSRNRSPEDTVDTAVDTYVLPPFFGPERIWKHRRVRFSTRKNMFKATIWEYELLELSSRPGEGAWVTIHPLLPSTSETRRIRLIDTPPVEIEKVSKPGEAGDLRLLFCEPGARHSYLKISFGTDRARRSAWRAAAVKHIKNGRPPAVQLPS